MTTVSEMIDDIVYRYEDSIITVCVTEVDGLGDGVIAVGGEYDEIDDVIILHLFVNTKCPIIQSKIEVDSNARVLHEVYKTLCHEFVHRKQALEGVDTTLDVDLTRCEYMLTPTEVEAYAKADILLDLTEFGHSPDLDEYREMFNNSVPGSYDALVYIENYLDSQGMKY